MENFNKKLIELQTRVVAPRTKKNSFGGFNYRNLEQILEAAKPHLLDLGLSLNLTDEVINVGERFYIKATANLTDGINNVSSVGWAREDDSKKGMDSAQLTGSCSSYARKYALGGLLLLDDNKDPDSDDFVKAKKAAAHEELAEDLAKTKVKAESEGKAKAEAEGKTVLASDIKPLAKKQPVEVDLTGGLVEEDVPDFDESGNIISSKKDISSKVAAEEKEKKEVKHSLSSREQKMLDFFEEHQIDVEDVLKRFGRKEIKYISNVQFLEIQNEVSGK